MTFRSHTTTDMSTNYNHSWLDNQSGYKIILRDDGMKRLWTQDVDPLSYMVEAQTGHILRRNRRQIQETSPAR